MGGIKKKFLRIIAEGNGHSKGKNTVKKSLDNIDALLVLKITTNDVL